MELHKDRIVPINPALIYGKLTNGMNLFLLNNQRPQDFYELRLVVRVGSLMEKDDQQGYSHFLEHLGFKGTESFARYELIKVLQSFGISYGADVNAATHLLDTKYNLTVAKDNELTQLKMGIKILYEWAFKMNILQSDVEEEKHVINSELRAKRGVSERLLKKYWSSLFGNSLVGKRMPIGIPEVFMNATPEKLREYYHQWYTPENMSVVVVGPCDDELVSNSILQIIQEVFSSTFQRNEMLWPPSSSIPIQVPRHHDDVAVCMIDKELSLPQLSLEFFLNTRYSTTFDFVIYNTQLKLLSSILDRRFSVLRKRREELPSKYTVFESSNCPFLSIGFTFREIFRGLTCCGVTAILQSRTSDLRSTVNLSLQALLLELKRLYTLGITEDEFMRAKLKWSNVFSEQLHHDTSTSSSMANDIVDHIVNNGQTVLVSFQEEAALSLKALDAINLGDMNDTIKLFDMHLGASESSYYSTTDSTFRVISVQLPESKSDNFNDSQLFQMLQEGREFLQTFEVLPWTTFSSVAKDEITGLAEHFVIKSPGYVAPCCQQCDLAYCQTCELQQYVLTDISAIEYVLPNGLKVCCKWMPNESPGKISMQAFCLGGNTELTPAEDTIMTYLDVLIHNSSICLPDGQTINAKDLHELESTTKVNLNVQRHFHHRGLGGSCPSSHVELLLSILLLRLKGQRIDLPAFEDLIHQQLNFLESRDLSPEFIFMNRARELTCGDMAICNPLTKEVLGECSLPMAQDLLIRGFQANPTEFTYVFVGDLPEPAIFREMIQKYLGSLTSTCRQQISPWVKNKESSPFTVLNKNFEITKSYEVFHMREADKASKLIAFRAYMPLDENKNISATIHLDASCKVLQTLLLEELRIKLGKVYSLVVEFSRNSMAHFALVSIVLHCDKEDIHQVFQTICSTIEQVQLHGPSEESIRGILEVMAKNHKQALQSTSHWLFWILDTYKGLNLMKHAEALDDIDHSTWVNKCCQLKSVEKINVLKAELTVENIQKAVQLHFKLEKMVHLDLCPTDTEKNQTGETVNIVDTVEIDVN